MRKALISKVSAARELVGSAGSAWLRASYRDSPDEDWWSPADEFTFRIGDRLHPFCTLVRNDVVVRSSIELVGDVSWATEWAAEKAARRDTLLTRYHHPR